MSQRSLAYLAGAALRVILAVVPDCCALAGAALTAYGAGLVYRPAGFITGGMLLMAIAFLAARGEGRA
jgi:hypothetical protein